MNYLIEVNVPGEGWRPLEVTTVTLAKLLVVLRDLYPDDELHGIRFRRLTTRQNIINARLAVHRYWKTSC